MHRERGLSDTAGSRVLQDSVRWVPQVAKEPQPHRVPRRTEMNTTHTRAAITVTILPNATNNPPGKLADAELHFVDAPLTGLKLIGFAVWERRTGGGRNVTFPA